MKIIKGLFDHMVMQRNGNDVSEQYVSGNTQVAGDVYFRSRNGAKNAPCANWQLCGKSDGKKFSACLRGLPVGGPYLIELMVKNKTGQTEQLVVKDVLVGDVWVLAGQSNMEGYGNLPAKLDVMPRVRCFYMTDRWAVAKEPLHDIYSAVDPVHKDLTGPNPPKKNPKKGAGPGIHFGMAMARQTGVPHGLIACAHGGTSMDQWDPRKKRLKGRSLYGAMLRRIEHNGGKVAGILWYQGCSDATLEFHPHYTRKMVAFVRAIRKDLKSPRLPFVMAQIARVNGPYAPNPTAWNSIQNQQYHLPEKISRLAVVPTVDLTLDDCVHVDYASFQRLGKRLAMAALALTDKKYKKGLPIEVNKVNVLVNKLDKTADIRISFRNVIGRLISDGMRPEGFSVADVAGNPKDVIYKTILEQNAVLLKTSFPIEEIRNYQLAYGLGCNPFCNITDQEDRSLPAFSGLRLGKPKMILPYVRTFAVSKTLPLTDCPSVPTVADKTLGWQKKTFEINFANVHDDLVSQPGKNVRIYFANQILCKKSINASLWLGYDGPVCVWLDGKRVFSDPKGTNPARPNDAQIPVRLSTGKHDLIISLDSNQGAAYGIFLRIQIHGLSESKMRQLLTDPTLLDDWLIVSTPLDKTL